ncbi:MAG: GNAT family N-acetyltransferase [Blastocatellia bacterium]|nr:GNAT family N-acetyltransferase [Blastocatellia bacterium]
MTSAPSIPGYTIRECVSFEDYAACIEMQRIVWQFEDLDVTAPRSFIVTRKGGGFTYGAFDEAGRMIGFSLALPAFDERLRPYYYSQMLAVLPEYRDAGIGMRLKLAQRDHALRTGIPLITWTFDPLQSRNAYLNIIKLGCVVRKYFVNYYGHGSTSVLHRGLDTDRLFPEWWVGSDHVRGALAGTRRTDAPAAVIEVPRDIEAIKVRDLDEARDWQLRIRRGFLEHLSEGLYCAGFDADPQGHSRYLFFKDERREMDERYR